jgi:hypothetical protein
VLLAVLSLAPAADAGRRSGPQYNDPPSYDGPRRAPATRPPPAPAKGPTVTLSELGRYPDLLVDEAGTAHIAWTEDRGDQADVARYCRLKRGATACDTQATLQWEKPYGVGDGPQYNSDNGGPRIVRVGDQLVIFSARYPTIGEKPDGASSSTVIAWTSADGGTTWVGPAVVGKRALGDLVTIGPDNDPTILNFGVDPLCGAPGPSAGCIQAYKSGQYSGASGNLTTETNQNYYPTMVLDRGTPVMAISHLSGKVLVRRWNGQGSPLDPNAWSQNGFPGNETELAGGPAGAYLLARPAYSGPYEVKALSAQPDGTMTPGPPVSITSDDAPGQFGELAEDPSGRLHAAWSDTRTENGGLRLRSTAAPASATPNFDDQQTLADGFTNGQIALDATNDGGGFVGFNHTGGVNSEGQVQAVGFGSQGATGQPGLGDLPGGSGGGTDETCRRAKFGSFTIDAAQGCLLNGTGANSNVIVSAGEVNIQGLRIIPDADCKLVIDYKKFRIDTVGGDAQVMVSGPGVGDVVLWHGQIHRDLSSVKPGTNLFEFPAGEFKAKVFGFPIPSNIPVRLEKDGVHIPIEIGLPKAFGGFTGRAELIADSQKGLHVDSLEIDIGPIPIGALVIEEIKLKYSGANDVWEGAGAARVIGGGRLDATAKFEMGSFKGATMSYTPSTPITIGPFVYLLRIGGGLYTDPGFKLLINGLVGAGVAIEGQAPVTVDGEFTMTFPPNGPAEFAMTGKLNVLLFQVANGTLRFITDGYADFRGHTGLDVGPLVVDANLDGFVDVSGQWGANLDGTIEVCFKIAGIGVCPSVGSDAAISSVGLALCAEATVDPPGPGEITATGGVEYKWEDFDGYEAFNPAALTAEVLTSIRVPCSTSGFAIPPPRPKKAQAGGGTVLSVPGGLPSYTVALEGDGGVPRVAVTGPNGVAFNSDTPSAAGYVVEPRGMNAAYVVLNKPAAGDYTITPLDGSPGIKQTLVSQGYKPASVRSARLGGRGRSRTIAYRVSGLGRGQRVTFLETGAFGTRIIGSVNRARGTLRFKPADARGGRREVVALVEHDGFVTERKRVGFYTAPGPVRPGAVRGLKARRRGTSVTVSWRRLRGASRYVVKLRGRQRGTGTARFVPGRARSVRIPAVRKDDRITISVRAVSPKMRQGAARTVRLRPLRR